MVEVVGADSSAGLCSCANTSKPDPAAIAPLNALLSVEKDRKVPHALIRHAIEACAIVDQPDETAAGTQEEKGLARAEMTSATMEPDREVIEI